MPDDHTLDATGEPLEYGHLDPDRRTNRREAAKARTFRQLPPGPIGRWGRRSQRNASNVQLAILACVGGLVLLVSRAATGQWIHGWSALATLIPTYGLLALFGWLNRPRT